MEQIPFSDGERTCPMCGKIFIAREGEWAYKRRDSNHRVKYFCSWGCLQKFDQQKPKKVAAEKREKLIELIKRGMTASEIVRTTGIEKTKVRYWMDRVAREGDK